MISESSTTANSAMEASPRVAVVVASKHGSTLGIAEAIRSELSGSGLQAKLFVADEFTSFEGADAVVMGSAVYAGHWLSDAQKLLDQNAAELSERPVWLFSSGPVGDPPSPENAVPPAVDRAAAEINARDHKVFSGKIDRELLGFAERTVVRALRVPSGDFRDWDEIERWASDISHALCDSPERSDAGASYIQSGTVPQCTVQ